MPDNHASIAVSLAKILINMRQEFVDALLASAKARIEANRTSTYSVRAEIPRFAVEAHADEALYAVYREGLGGLEDNIRYAVDEIVREGLDAARKTPLEWRPL
jgi:hypothetical protein